MDLEDKTALVTGAGRGLGREISLAFAREGARVCMFSLARDELEDAAARIAQAGGECAICPGDVASERDVTSALSLTMKRFGGIDILVNNAGIIGPARFLEETTPERWRQVMDVNLTGSYLCCRGVAAHMKDSGGGAIITITSGLGQMPFPRFSAYAVSKAGLIQLTRSLSEELRPFHIRVNGIDPGLMDTDLGAEIRSMGPSILGEDLYRTMVDYKEKSVLKDPADVAELAVFLASGRSAGLSGHIGTLRYYRDQGYKA